MTTRLRLALAISSLALACIAVLSASAPRQEEDAPPPVTIEAPAPGLETAANPAPPGTVTRKLGRLTLSLDPSRAVPGQILPLYLRTSVGPTYAVLHGGRVPFLGSPHGYRALVPIPATASPGPATLGVEVLTRRGRQRFPVEITIGRRAFPTRRLTIPETRRHLLASPQATTDGRRLLLALRTTTSAVLWRGSFVAPVSALPMPSYGCPETWTDAAPVDSLLDSQHGEYHRGLDYETPIGTPVTAPAAGTVLLAAPLTLSGPTVVLDHGQGLVSVLFHLSRIEVREGDRVGARDRLGQSGDSGIAPFPHLHWGAYLHGVAVDPAGLLRAWE